MNEPEYLYSLSRKELQVMAKEKGLKANASTSSLIDQLLGLSCSDSESTPTKEASYSKVAADLAPVSQSINENVSNSGFGVTRTPRAPTPGLGLGAQSNQKSSLKARFQTQTVLQLVSTPQSDDDDDDDYSPQPSGSTAKKAPAGRTTSMGRMFRINTPLAAIVSSLPADSTSSPMSAGGAASSAAKPPAAVAEKECAWTPKGTTPKQANSDTRKSSGKKKKSSVKRASASSGSDVAAAAADQASGQHVEVVTPVAAATAAAADENSLGNNNHSGGGLTPNLLSDFALEQPESEAEVEAEEKVVCGLPTGVGAGAQSQSQAVAAQVQVHVQVAAERETAAQNIPAAMTTCTARQSIEAWAAVLDDDEDCGEAPASSRAQQSANSNTLDAPTAKKAPRPTSSESSEDQAPGEDAADTAAVAFVDINPPPSPSSSSPLSSSNVLGLGRAVIPASWNSSPKMSPTIRPTTSVSASSSKKAFTRHSAASARKMSSSASVSAPSTPVAGARSAARQSCPRGGSPRPVAAHTSPQGVSQTKKEMRQEALAMKLAVYTTSPTDVNAQSVHVAPVPAPKMTKSVALMTAARQAKAVEMERKVLEDTAAAKPGLRLETKKAQPSRSHAAPVMHMSKGPTKHAMVPSCANIRPAVRPPSPEAAAFKARAMPTFKAVTVTMNKAAVVAAAAIAAPPKFGGLGKPAAPIATIAHRPTQHSTHDPKENNVPTATAAITAPSKRASTASKTFNLSSSNRGASAKTSKEEAKAKVQPLSPLHNAMDNSKIKPKKGQKTPCKNPFESIAM